MREPRNPFKWRASENIVNDSTFLRLFGTRTLELLPLEPWNKVLVIQSAPGGGKTTLMRLFTPSALRTLFKNRGNEDYKDLYRKVESMGAFATDGPALLSAMLSCSQGYSMLEDLDIDSVQKERLLYSLLNVRIILATLRGACILQNLEYPKDLTKFTIDTAKDYQYSDGIGIPVPCTADKLASWAIGIEESICEAIDSFDNHTMPTLKGHDSLYSLHVLRPDLILFENRTFIDQVVIMLDDVHKLATRQQNKLLDSLIGQRWPVGIWLAERIEALSKSELLSPGAASGRDYDRVSIEEYWRDNKRFESIVNNIADKRIGLIPDTQISNFAGMLEDSVGESKYKPLFEKAYQAISSRLLQKHGADPRFREWLEQAKNSSSTGEELAVEWRKLEIIMERKTNESQLALPLPFSTEELTDSSSPIKAPAEYFISQEFDIPYYFSSSNLATLASSNFEQYLDFAGELFEHLLPSIILNKQLTLSPELQQGILKKVADRRWKEIPYRVPNSREVIALLQSIIELSKSETNRPNTPYGAVTGIGISEKERKKLINIEVHTKNPGLKSLYILLADCISNNLLEPRFIHQGSKGQESMVLYLNRWICLYSDLPLQYGGWRHVTCDKLLDWCQRGYQDTERKLI